MKATDLTNLAIDWMRAEFPGSVIVTELSVSDWGGASIDIAAITETEIIGVEVKGEGDSPYRLALQGCAYSRVARHMWLLPTPDGTLAQRCQKHKPKGWGVLTIRDGKVMPKSDFSQARELPDQSPWHLCGTLWRDELYDIALDLGVVVKGHKPARVFDLTSALCDQVPVTKLHDATIAALRRRDWKRTVIDTRIKLEPQYRHQVIP